MTIPNEFPQQPPTAHFRTPIFHPNVDPQTGGVCVETLKRDWDSKLTLRDVLVTISCLLIQPNPDSALNAEAGALIQEDYEAFTRRAELMTSIHAAVPKALQLAVKEAQERGQEKSASRDKSSPASTASEAQPPPMKRRRQTARRCDTARSRASDGSPTSGLTRRRPQTCTNQPFVVQALNDDVFGSTTREQEPSGLTEYEDSCMQDANQENDESKSPVKFTPSKAATPRRPQGVAVPLGELTMDDVLTDSDEEDEEPEYPPSPRKSPTKSPAKRKQQYPSEIQPAESSRDATIRARNITPVNFADPKPLAENSLFAGTPSPRKVRARPPTPGSGKAPLFPSLSTPVSYGGIFKTAKTKVPSSAEKKRQEAGLKGELDAKLWELCGRDIKRWNKGDFDGEPFPVKAKRW